MMTALKGRGMTATLLTQINYQCDLKANHDMTKYNDVYLLFSI